jgi:hypothetical protein
MKFVGGAREAAGAGQGGKGAELSAVERLRHE